MFGFIDGSPREEDPHPVGPALELGEGICSVFSETPGCLPWKSQVYVPVFTCGYCSSLPASFRSVGSGALAGSTTQTAKPPEQVSLVQGDPALVICQSWKLSLLLGE